MSSTTELWTWEQGAPPGPQTARAGTRWTFRLPLTGKGTPPKCMWFDLPWGTEARQAAPDALTLVVAIPADLSGIHTLRYRIGDNALAGELLLKILPAKDDIPQPPPATPPAPDQGATAPEAAPAPTPYPAPPPAAAPTPAAPMALPPTDVSAPAPPLTGDYEVRVYRGGTLIAQLTQPILPHQSLLVGKFSASKLVMPDIDLRGHFPNQRGEEQCSRRQVKVYWSEGRIRLQNVGKSLLRLPGDRNLPSTESYDWQPGEEVGLPGGLSLRLERRGD